MVVVQGEVPCDHVIYGPFLRYLYVNRAAVINFNWHREVSELELPLLLYLDSAVRHVEQHYTNFWDPRNKTKQRL